MEEKLFDVVIINDKIVTTREHRTDKEGEHTTGVFQTINGAKKNAHKLEQQFGLEYK